LEKGARFFNDSFPEFSWDGAPAIKPLKVVSGVQKSQLTGEKGVKSGNQSGWSFLIA